MLFSFAGVFYQFLVLSLLETRPEKETSDFARVLLMIAFPILTTLALGFYLLFGGRCEHDLMMAVPVGAMQEGRLNQLQLSEKEQKLFAEWLEANPAETHRDLVDQVALFRDSLKPKDE